MQIKKVIIGSAVNTAKYITLPKVHCNRFLLIADNINPTKDTIKGTARTGIAITIHNTIANAAPKFSGDTAISIINHTVINADIAYKTAATILSVLKLLILFVSL